jgi:glutamyl-tRNA synthetase
MNDVRVRFAPSPTGYLHIGGVRTALFNWLLARHHKGKFILRIEDTDQGRSTDEAIHAILEGLRWVGLDWDEGPFRQTERMDLYRQHAMRLFEKGRAYWCVCTAEELEARRAEAQAKGLHPGYDGRCRNLGITSPSGEAALRFKAQQEGQTIIDDLVKGRVVFDNSVLDDLIILRSNGYPTYNFSVVVDDALMNVTHVLRGDDHLNNTPRQIPMFGALGFPIPRFGHLAMILGSDKTKLSKRHGATSILAYRDMGYLPEAMLNYLVRLGWSFGDQEVFSLQELIEKFTLEHVQKSAAVFNPEKLLWLNAHYIKESDPKRVGDLLMPYLEELGLASGVGSLPSGWLERFVTAYRERAKTLADMAAATRPYVSETIELDPEAAGKFLTPMIVPVMETLLTRLEALRDFSRVSVETVFHEVQASSGMKMGQIAQPVRVALIGGTASPGIYEVIGLLGRDRTLERLRLGIGRARSARA